RAWTGTSAMVPAWQCAPRPGRFTWTWPGRTRIAACGCIFRWGSHFEGIVAHPAVLWAMGAALSGDQPTAADRLCLLVLRQRTGDALAVAHCDHAGGRHRPRRSRHLA